MTSQPTSDFVAPCMSKCLQGTDIRALVKAIAEVERDGRPREDAIAEAWQIVTARNPLPATCGRICPHPCEDFCVRNDKDESVSINHIERFIGDWGIAHGFTFEKLTQECQPEKIAVIGSGPAGLSYAFQMARRGYAVTLFEAFPKAGGMLRYGIPAYRLPRSVLDAEIEKILALGINFRPNTAIGRDVSLESLKAQYDAVFVGIGTQKAAKLGCPGKETQGVFGGVEFLRLVNSGQAIDLGREVVIVGGGNTAIDAARVARRLDAHATILYRRTRAEMPAIADEIAAAEDEGVVIIYLGAPLEIISENGRIARLRCQKMQLSDPDASGRRKPVPLQGETFELTADALIVAVSQEADWGGLEMVRKGRLAAEAMHAKFRQLELPPESRPEVIAAQRLLLDAVRSSPRHQQEKLAAAARLVRPWAEESSTFSFETAVKEAARCISCGESFIKRPKTHPIHVFRRISQIGVGTFLFNSYFAVFSTKTLYDGPLRSVCVPGLNCHSCPTATMGCPIGILQHFAAIHKFPWFLMGFLGLVGLLSGRFTCGWLCPWGMVQDVTHRIKKFAVRIPRILNYLKYAMLVVVCIIIPYFTFEHWFSKLCPCGGLIAAIPWALWNPVDPVLGEVYIPAGMIGFMFWLKMWILGAFLILFLFIKRPFCRTVCPLGAIYALFNRLSLVQLKVSDGCVDCGQCRAVCPTDLDVRRQVNSEACIKCLECTQCQHIKFKWNRFDKLRLKKWPKAKIRTPESPIPIPVLENN